MPPPSPLRIIIHDLDHARWALAVARTAGRVVTLESPAGAAGWQGIGWWLALLTAIRVQFPDVTFASVLDCGDAPGLALAALRAGVPEVRLEAEPPVLAKIAGIAEQTGGRVGENPGGRALDLLGAPDLRRAVEDFFAECHSTAPSPGGDQTGGRGATSKRS